MNVEGRDRIFDLVRQRFPDAEPIDKVLDWIYEISQTRVVGSNMPNPLNIADFDDIDIAVLENLFRGNETRKYFLTSARQQANITPEQLDARIAKLTSAVIFPPTALDLI